MSIGTSQAVFSNGEVTCLLVEDGFMPGSKGFYAERARRYYPVPGGWAERADWDGDRKKMP